jgi:integrase
MWIGGERVRRSFDTRAEAERYVEEMLERRSRALAEAALAQVPTLTVADLCRRWFAAKSSKLAPGTAVNYETAIRLRIVPQLGTRDANLITDAELEDFYKTCTFDPARKAHQVLRSAFTWGRRNVPELVRHDNPVLCVKPSRRDCVGHDGTFSYDDDDVRPVDEKKIPLPDEVEKLLADAESTDPTWWVYLVLIIATAGRPGEICALRRGDIDVCKCTVTIGWSADRASLRVKRPKSRWSIRTLEIPRDVVDRLVPHLPQDEDAFLFPADPSRSPMPCWNGRGVHRRLTPRRSSDAACHRTRRTASVTTPRPRCSPQACRRPNWRASSVTRTTRSSGSSTGTRSRPSRERRSKM